MKNALSLAARAIGLAAVFGAALTASGEAQAQVSCDPRMTATYAPVCNPATGQGFDLRLFRSAVDSKGLFSVNGTDILGAGDISFGFVGDVGFNMLRIGTNADGTIGAPLVNVGFTGALQFNYGIANLLVVGAQVPIHILGGPGRGGEGVGRTFEGVQDNVYNPPMGGLNFQGVGDITLHAKLRWLRAEYFPVGLAILLQGGWGPMRGPYSFSGEPGGFLWPSAAVEVRPSRRTRLDFNLGARVPFALGNGSVLGANGYTTQYGPSVTWGAGVSFRPVPVLDLVAETYGQLYLTGLGSVPVSMPMEVVGGIKIFVQRNSYLMLGGGGRIPIGNAFAAADARAFLGIVFEPSIGDTDGDGYRDDVDQCINDPEDFDNFQDDDGCSDPDNDRDGILDQDDQCPIIPEDRDNDHDTDGCPEGQTSDRDGDGLEDNADRCPDDPEDRDQFQDEDGCSDPDNDNDQILDTLDNCPNEPEDTDNFQDDDGCPDPDNDGDGVLDANDHSSDGTIDCRNDRETFNGVDDEDGCPDSGDLQILGTEIRLREQIQFETDSAEIRPVSMPIIEQMTNLLRRNPQFTQVEIEGHTDERAADDHNQQLSRDRANSVMQELVRRGIEATRLVGAGYGEYCPLDPGHNARAWERNRRVSFIITRTRDEGRTTATVGCRRAAAFIPAEIGPPGTGAARLRADQPAGATTPASGGATPPTTPSTTPPTTPPTTPTAPTGAAPTTTPATAPRRP